MRGQVVRAEIGFDFHDFADALHAVRLVDEQFSEQFHARRQSCRGRKMSAAVFAWRKGSKVAAKKNIAIPAQ